MGLVPKGHHLETSSEDHFQVTWGHLSTQEVHKLYLSPQKLDAGGWERDVQNPTSLLQGGTGSAVLFQFQRITKRSPRIDFWNLTPAYFLSLLYPASLIPLQVSPESIPSIKNSQIKKKKREKPSKQTKIQNNNNKKTKTQLCPRLYFQRIQSKTYAKIIFRSI